MTSNETISVLKNPAAFFATNHAVISLRGNDTVGFLNRLATNDMSALLSHGFVSTAFTTNKGRMVDHCLAFRHSLDEILLVSSHDDASILLSWLDQYLFVDDVEMTTSALRFCYRVGATDADARVLWQTQLLHHELLTISGSFAAREGASISFATWDSLRILALMPSSPHEINDAVMPHNINLVDDISETKGCYIGQEVIAKARTYQRHVKSLCGIALDEDAWRSLSPSQRIKNHRGQWGQVTSVAPHYVPGEVNALVLTDLSIAKNSQDDALSLVSANFIFKIGTSLVDELASTD